jgi:MerR family transcriptional regulator, redox-sensitive transcriptional activator SoxR
MVGMSISEVARQAGVRPSALRYYESIGLLPEPERVSGRRRYDADAVQRLAIIQTAQQAGFTLAELRLLFDDILPSTSPSDQWHALIQRKLRDIEARLQSIHSMKNLLEDIRDCADTELAECIYWIGQKRHADG